MVRRVSYKQRAETHLEALREVHGEGGRYTVRGLSKGSRGLQKAMTSVVVQEVNTSLRHHHHSPLYSLTPSATPATAAATSTHSAAAGVAATSSSAPVVLIVDTPEFFLYFLFSGGHVYVCPIRVCSMPTSLWNHWPTLTQNPLTTYDCMVAVV